MPGSDATTAAGGAGGANADAITTSQSVVATETNSNTAYAVAPIGTEAGGIDAGYGGASGIGAAAVMGTGEGAYNATGSPITPFMGEGARIRGRWRVCLVVGLVGGLMVV